MVEKVKHQHLIKTKAFWFFLLVPVVGGIILAGVIAFNEPNLSPCFSSSCVQNFFTLYKFPVACAGLALPLVAMVAAIHRSKEAALQISIGQQQYHEAVLNNRFGNYLKHREGFDKLLDGFVQRENLSGDRQLFIAIAKLYADLYPESGFNNPNWLGSHDKVFFDELESIKGELHCEVIAGVKNFDFDRFVSALGRMQEKLNISYIPCRYLYTPMNDVMVRVPAKMKPHYAFGLAAFDALETYMHVAVYTGGRQVNLLADIKTLWLTDNIKNCEGKYGFQESPDLFETSA